MMVPRDISFPLAHLLASGVDVSISRSGLSVTTAGGVIVRQNPKRVGLIIQSTTPQPARVGPFPDVSSSRGFLLPGAGSTLSVDLSDYALPALAWFASPPSDSYFYCTVIEFLLSRELRKEGPSDYAD